jgi:PilZ domain
MDPAEKVSLQRWRWCTLVGEVCEGDDPMTTNAERRSGKRLNTHLPTRVRSQGAEHSGQTRDISSNGVFLYTNSRMEKGTDVELVLILPPELTSGEKRCWVCCQATIVRVEENGREFGVAAKIRRIDMLPEVAI